jgi:hypothetical protein
LTLLKASATGRITLQIVMMQIVRSEARPGGPFAFRGPAFNYLETPDGCALSLLTAPPTLGVSSLDLGRSHKERPLLSPRPA